VCFYYLEFDVANARCCRALPPKLRLMNGTSIHLMHRNILPFLLRSLA
jgi:hypothetical protein